MVLAPQIGPANLPYYITNMPAGVYRLSIRWVQDGTVKELTPIAVNITERRISFDIEGVAEVAEDLANGLIYWQHTGDYYVHYEQLVAAEWLLRYSDIIRVQ